MILVPDGYKVLNVNVPALFPLSTLNVTSPDVVGVEVGVGEGTEVGVGVGVETITVQVGEVGTEALRHTPSVAPACL